MSILKAIKVLSEIDYVELNKAIQNANETLDQTRRILDQAEDLAHDIDPDDIHAAMAAMKKLSAATESLQPEDAKKFAELFNALRAAAQRVDTKKALEIADKLNAMLDSYNNAFGK